MQSGKNVSAAIFRKTALRNRQRFLWTVSDIENYIGNPQLEHLCLLATYLHISIDAIFSWPENEPGFYHAANHGRTKFLPEGQKQLLPLRVSG